MGVPTRPTTPITLRPSTGGDIGSTGPINQGNPSVSLDVEETTQDPSAQTPKGKKGEITRIF